MDGVFYALVIRVLVAAINIIISLVVVVVVSMVSMMVVISGGFEVYTGPMFVFFLAQSAFFLKKEKAKTHV